MIQYKRDTPLEGRCSKFYKVNSHSNSPRANLKHENDRGRKTTDKEEAKSHNGISDIITQLHTHTSLLLLKPAE